MASFCKTSRGTYAWPKCAEKWLERLWAGGISSSLCAEAICREYGVEISRNAVIAKVHRLNLVRTNETIADFEVECGL